MNFKKEKLPLQDELLLPDGQLVIPRQKPTRLVGQVIVKNGLTGKTMFTFNDIIIPGSTYILEKFFNRRSNFGMTTLSEDLGINDSVVPSLENLKDEVVFGFVLGIGAVQPPEIVKAVKFNHKNVETIVPFRVVDINNDLSPSEAAKYAMKKTVGNKYYYYAKKFDSDVVIRHLFTDGTEIPPNIDQTDTNLGLLVFGEAVLTISQDDLREYFMLTYGNTDKCLFNSMGLVAGFLNNGDYAGVRVVTKLNMPNMFLQDSESFYTFVYRVYAI